MKIIPLTRGQVAFVDDCDYELLSAHKWHAHFSYRDSEGRVSFYAYRWGPFGKDKKRSLIMMHHVIIGKPSNGYVTDHADGNGLNNQRENISHVTYRVNQQNLHCKKASCFPGVTWHKKIRKWQSQADINGKRTYIGLFADELSAYKAYLLKVEEEKR